MHIIRIVHQTQIQKVKHLGPIDGQRKTNAAVSLQTTISLHRPSLKRQGRRYLRFVSTTLSPIVRFSRRLRVIKSPSMSASTMKHSRWNCCEFTASLIKMKCLMPAAGALIRVDQCWPLLGWKASSESFRVMASQCRAIRI